MNSKESPFKVGTEVANIRHSFGKLTLLGVFKVVGVHANGNVIVDFHHRRQQFKPHSYFIPDHGWVHSLSETGANGRGVVLRLWDDTNKAEVARSKREQEDAHNADILGESVKKLRGDQLKQVAALVESFK